MSEAVLPRKSFFTGVALPAVSWGLPFHSLIVAILFGVLHFQANTVRMFAAWKELTVVGLVAYVIIRAITGRGPKVWLSWIDIAVGSLLVIAFAFFIGSGSLLRIELPRIAELYGFRDGVFFLLLYFVGRASPEIADDPDTLRRLYIITVLTCAIAVVERFFVTPDRLVLIGVASYIQNFLNAAPFTAGNPYGLPMNYWTTIGSTTVQRAGSVYLSSQGFAVPFLVLLPVSTAWFFGAIKHRTATVKLDYAIIWIGILFSVTRMTIIVCAIQLFVMILMLRKPEWAVAGLVTGFVVFLMLIVVLPGLPGFVWDTITWQTGSSASHINDWSKGFNAFFERPWGWGLGTTDESAIRSGLDPVTADNGYFKYAIELGAQGLIAHLAIYLGIGIMSFRVARTASTESRRLLGTVVFLTTVGVVINAITGVVFNALVLSYLYFWFAGVIVTVAQREAAAKEVRAPIGPVLAPA
ncbi:MAG TPA: O-antigen ligase family protein [Gemmatimonadaceae bacterium]|nr:O-antigen ligase family protein [Gemmatimonadaceae bacterium]